MKKEKTSLWLLFWTFAKMGVMTFGGGYAMLPILQREVIDNRGWATEEELMDYFAIGQCTPGIIAVNTATLRRMSRQPMTRKWRRTPCGTRFITTITT